MNSDEDQADGEIGHMDVREPRQGSFYWIRVKGGLNKTFPDRYRNVTISPCNNNETLITVFIADQAALRGLLEYLWDMNIDVLSVERRS